jgi:hypothetical protein
MPRHEIMLANEKFSKIVAGTWRDWLSQSKYGARIEGTVPA